MKKVIKVGKLQLLKKFLKRNTPKKAVKMQKGNEDCMFICAVIQINPMHSSYRRSKKTPTFSTLVLVECKIKYRVIKLQRKTVK